MQAMVIFADSQRICATTTENLCHVVLIKGANVW